MNLFDGTMVKLFIPLVRAHRKAKDVTMPNIALIKKSRLAFKADQQRSHLGAHQYQKTVWQSDR